MAREDKIDRPEFDTKERVLPAGRVRSADKTGHMRYVLLFGIVGVIVAFVIAWLLGVRF